MSRTQPYAQQFPGISFVEWPDGRQVSAAGFGCYRVNLGSKAHEQALRLALGSGINLIDTSANYADGKSEELVGTVLRDMAENIRRENIVLVTKAGYIQGQNLAVARKMEEKGKPFREIVQYGEGLWHCIHPAFLEDQITRSLERLRQDRVDALLLHNPEYFLSHAAKHGMPRNAARAEFYRRIEAAFRHLEKEVLNGRIACYGISSNTFPKSSTDPEFCSLERVWEIAESISTAHSFRVIQLPFNIMENDAACEPNQKNNTQTALEFAEEKKLFVLINRPLNAIGGDHLIRLAEYPVQDGQSTESLKEKLHSLVRHEGEFYVNHLSGLPLHPKDASVMREYLSPGATLERYWKSFSAIERWNDVREQYLLPRIESALDALEDYMNLELREWKEKFLILSNEAFDAVSSYYALEMRERNRKIKKALSEGLGKDFSGIPLSRLAFNVLRATKGVSSVLVGMRKEQYVRDILTALGEEFAPLGREEWTSIREKL